MVVIVKMVNFKLHVIYHIKKKLEKKNKEIEK